MAGFMLPHSLGIATAVKNFRPQEARGFRFEIRGETGI